MTPKETSEDHGRPRITLVDAADESGRTTATLVASLAGRLLALHYMSGVSVVGSLVAGLAAVGREVGRTAEGARMRRALEQTRAGRNGDALWEALKIPEWTGGLPPSPVLDHVRNDLALLFAEDLEATLDDFTVAPPEYGKPQSNGEVVPVTSVDCLLGLWAYSREIVQAVTALAADGPPFDPIERGDPPGEPGLLR
jgi:hypothetical protein